MQYDNRDHWVIYGLQISHNLNQIDYFFENEIRSRVYEVGRIDYNIIEEEDGLTK